MAVSVWLHGCRSVMRAQQDSDILSVSQRETWSDDIFDPEITSPLNFLWPSRDSLMNAFDFSLFLEPLLRVDADPLSVREIYLRGPSPHTLLKMAHSFCFVTSNTPPLLLMPPTPTTSPRATGAESEGEMDDVVLNCDMSPCESFHYYS